MFCQTAGFANRDAKYEVSVELFVMWMTFYDLFVKASKEWSFNIVEVSTFHDIIFFIIFKIVWLTSNWQLNMGVPAFFRWLSRKYPSVIIECVENKVSNFVSEMNLIHFATDEHNLRDCVFNAIVITIALQQVLFTLNWCVNHCDLMGFSMWIDCCHFNLSQLIIILELLFILFS